MLAGGGSEGDIDAKTDWSYPLYRKLVENGDTNGDHKIKVVVISLEKPDTNFMVDYFKSMGADVSENLVVDSRAKANNPKLVKTLKDADVIFFRGGNQGHAYQYWKDTLLHKEIINLEKRNGAIGGTSSGTMGLAQYSITGGKDFSSKEVMSDAYSDLLNDEIHKKTSGIHNDFLNVADNMIVDTHCGERGRLGRLLSAMAKATEDFNNNKMIGLCLEERTGIIISKGKATVYGTGLAHFATEDEETQKDRRPNHSLSYTGVHLDALSEGWTYDLEKRSTDESNTPVSAKKLNLSFGCGQVKKGFKSDGEKTSDLTFEQPSGTNFIAIAKDANAEEKISSGDKKKGAIQTRAFLEMAKDPRESVMLLDESSSVRAVDDNIIKTFRKSGKGDYVPTLILDCSECTYTSESHFTSNQDDGSGKMKSKGFVNMRVHILGESASYDVSEHKASIQTGFSNDSISGQCKPLSPLKLDSFFANEKNIVKKLNCEK